MPGGGHAPLSVSAAAGGQGGVSSVSGGVSCAWCGVSHGGRNYAPYSGVVDGVGWELGRPERRLGGGRCAPLRWPASGIRIGS